MDQQKKKTAAIQRELAAVIRKEQHLRRAALRKTPPAWKQQLEQKVPSKVYETLHTAFCKGFSLVFSRGRAVIERSYSREDLEADHQIRDYAFRLTGRRKDFKQMRKAASQGSLKNMAVTTAEGVGLGLLGIGLPDIVLFLGTLLKGVYELALSYGFAYDTQFEQLLILKILAASLSTGDDWDGANAEVDSMLLLQNVAVTQEEWDSQLEATASAFAVDMLLLKFIQGLPLVGFLGGAANPFYYRRIMKYAEVKYRKRYLMKSREASDASCPESPAQAGTE